MKIDVECMRCAEENVEGGLNIEQMETKGPLFFNPNTRSQNQGYLCPQCGNEINVIVTIPENPHGRIQTGAKEVTRKK